MKSPPQKKRPSTPRKTKAIKESLEVIQIANQSESVVPIDGETYQEALRHAVIEMRVRGFTARQIAREVGKSERYIWDIIDRENEQIDHRQTSKEEHKRNAIRRCERLIQKYYPIAVADNYRMERFTKDGIPYFDENAIDVQFQAFNTVMKAEERLAKLVGFDEGEDDKQKAGITQDQLIFLAAKLPEIKPIETSNHTDIEAIEITPIPEIEDIK